ncbi:MAG: FHA domain-containing protein [Chloroflexi bacterium]|nr:FHA domain-containing protein [Chloroflexota bacterium]
MADPLISLVKIAGITLVITLLWALTLTTAYWDIQRRRQAGERVNQFAWMAVVAFLPFAGWIVYRIARLISTGKARNRQGVVKAGERRETRLKAMPEVREPLAAIPEPSLRKKTALSSPKPARAEGECLPSVRYKLSIVAGPEQGKQFIVDRFPAQIGRDLNSVIRLEQDTGVSRKHALIEQVNGTLRIRDLQSRHGTRVNEKPVGEQILKPGDLIEVGITSLLVGKIEEASVSAAEREI